MKGGTAPREQVQIDALGSVCSGLNFFAATKFSRWPIIVKLLRPSLVIKVVGRLWGHATLWLFRSTACAVVLGMQP